MVDDPKDENNWFLLKKEISIKTGFNCNEYTDSFLKRRVHTRLYALDLETYEDYIKRLIKDEHEKELLLKELTIHVTNFFRNKDAYDSFIAGTMMELLNEKKKNNKKSLKIWSAGCSTGEEPYTIAMILKEILGERVNDFFISIIGTDLSAETIEKAEKGVYDKIQLKETPPEYIERYFDKKGEFFHIKEEVKDMVRFEVADILNSSKPKCLDLLFCRNTVIYFKRELKEKLYLEFYHCIDQSGYFIMGMTESLSGSAKDLFVAIDNKNRIYKKK